MKEAITIQGDGVTHINIGNRAATELGRFLENSFPAPFTHPVFGYFATISGYWAWLKTDGTDVAMRYTRNPHKYREKLANIPKRQIPHFFRFIEEAVRLKLLEHPAMCQALIDSTLPFYCYNVTVNKDVYARTGSDGICVMMETIRADFKAGNFAIDVNYLDLPIYRNKYAAV